MWTALALLLALAPSAYWAWTARDMPYLGTEHDDSIYWVSAKSLAEGHGYRIASLPDEPYQTKYPPLFPLWLSLVWRISPAFPHNIGLAMLACWAWLPLYMIAVRWTLRGLGIARGHALVLCGLVGLNAQLILYSISLMPGILFCLLLFAALALAQRSGGSDWLAAGAGICVGLAYLTRSAATPLLVALPAFYLRRHKARQALICTVAALPAVIGWCLWVRAHMSAGVDPISLYYTNYFGFYIHDISWSDLPSVVVKNFDRFLWAAGSLVVFGQGDVSWAASSHPLLFTAMPFLCRLLGLFAVAAAARAAWRRGATAYHYFAAVYVPLLLIWHYPPNERFLLPLLPLLLAGLLSETRGLAGLLRRAFRSEPVHRLAAGLLAAGLGAVLGLALILNVRGFARGLPEFLRAGRTVQASDARAYQWISTHLPREATFLAYHDPVLYLYTGRRDCRPVLLPRFFYRGDDRGVNGVLLSLPEVARRQRLGYVFTSAFDFDWELLPAGNAVARLKTSLNRRRDLEAVYRSPLTCVYRVR